MLEQQQRNSSVAHSVHSNSNLNQLEEQSVPSVRPHLLVQTDQDYEISLDPAKKSKIKLSPIPQDTASNPIKFTYPEKSDDKAVDRPSDAISDVQNPVLTHYEELNYDDVLSRANQTVHVGGSHLEQDFHDLMNADEEEKLGECEGSNRLSSSRAQQEDDNSINPIKDFATKTSRIFADSESSRLNSSIVSQRGIDPFMITNSSVMSTYLYKAAYPYNSSIHSNVGSQLPSPSKTSSSIAGRTTGFRTTVEYPSGMNTGYVNPRAELGDPEVYYRTYRSQATYGGNPYSASMQNQYREITRNNAYLREMLQRNKTTYAEGEAKISKLKAEYSQLAGMMKGLEQELRSWKEKNSELRFKLNYAMQIKL